ncbi:MAG: hypothetical protein K2L87_03170, partial [Clostridiales bacterium]|nr:hypothetical protein [Clostridiales bacterium]
MTGNTATNGTGGVFLNNSTVNFKMTGGSIDHNTGSVNYAGGVYAGNSAVVSFGGNAVIEENTSPYTYGRKNFFHANNTAKYAIIADIKDGFHVGVTKETNNYTSPDGNYITSNWGKYTSESSVGKFFSDDTRYDVIDTLYGTTKEAAIWCVDGAKNWYDANEQSRALRGTAQTVTLYSDWVAAYNSSYNTTFHTDYANSSYNFYQGALRVYDTANIILDLNGHTLDRHLTAARSNGFVIYVSSNNSKLTIIDSSDDNSGKITGGFASNQAGAIYVSGGELKILGGTITKNRGMYGAIWIYYNAPSCQLTRGGPVEIYDNTLYN